jgi:hypothetical protein
VRRLALLGFAVLFVLAVVAAIPLLTAAGSASAAERALLAAEREAGLGHKQQAVALLERAGADAARAAGRLRGPIPSLARRVPVAGRSVRSAAQLTSSATLAARAARAALDVLPDRSPWSAGAVNVGALTDMLRSADGALRGFDLAAKEARLAPGRLVPGRLSTARTNLLAKLDRTRRTLRTTSAVLRVLPEVLGRSGPRRYFLAVQNPAELRATGGFWGNYGIIDVTAGRLRLTAFGRTTDDLGPGKLPSLQGPSWYQRRYGRFGAPTDWRGLNMCPDFPTVASLAERHLDRAPSGTGPVDGVIAVDPVGLSELLRLTGPVVAPGWDEPITADNVVRVTLREAYARFEDRERRADFLGEVAHAVWSKLLATDVPLRPAALSGLGRAVISRRIQIHLRRPNEQRPIADSGHDGGLGSPSGTFGLVTQNAAGNKLDNWLDRRVRYRVQLNADGSASVDARVTLRNGGPSAGQPSEVIGPYDDRFKPGVNRQYFSLYVPGGATLFETQSPDRLRGEVEDELGLSVFSRFVDIAPGGDVTLRYAFRVPEAWRGGRYEMILRRQPALAADRIDLQILAPKGWNAAGERVVTTRLDADRLVTVGLHKRLWSRLWDSLPF